MPYVTGPRAEIDDLVAEEGDYPVLLTRWQKRVLPADVLGVGDDVGQTRLPVETNAIVGGIPVANQRTVKILPEDSFRRVPGPMSVYMEEGEIVIARELLKSRPTKSALAAE